MNEEIYPNAPIVLMVAEIKHTEHGPLDEKQSRMISEAVKGTLPIRSEEVEQSITFPSAPDGSLLQPQVAQTKVLRWSSRDRRTVVTVKPDVISVETTQYHRYEDIRQLLEQALTAFTSAIDLAGASASGTSTKFAYRRMTIPVYRSGMNGSTGPCLALVTWRSDRDCRPPKTKAPRRSSAMTRPCWCFGTAHRTPTSSVQPRSFVVLSRPQGRCSSWISTVTGSQMTFLYSTQTGFSR